MRPKIALYLLMILWLFIGSVGCSDNDDTNIDNANQLVKKAAMKQIERLKQLSPDYMKQIGISRSEFNQIKLGKPFQIYMVGIGDIKYLEEDQDPCTYLIDLKKQIFPVNVGTLLKTSISIKYRKGEWKPSSIGKTEIHTLEKARKEVFQSNTLYTSSPFAVRIPAMYMVFLGHYNDTARKELYLTPIHPHPHYTFTLLKSKPAYEVFKELRPHIPKYQRIFKSPKPKTKIQTKGKEKKTDKLKTIR